MDSSNSDELRHKLEECFNRYSFEYVWLYMKNKEDICSLYPKLVNELYDIISEEKSKIDG
jgi:hypothetical protein